MISIIITQGSFRRHFILGKMAWFFWTRTLPMTLPLKLDTEPWKVAPTGEKARRPSADVKARVAMQAINGSKMIQDIAIDNSMDLRHRIAVRWDPIPGSQ